MYTKKKIPPRGCSNTDAAISRKEKTRNSISITHNRSRRNNQPGNIYRTNFTGETPPVGFVPGTIAEYRRIKDQFKNFQDKAKNMYCVSSIIQETSSS